MFLFKKLLFTFVIVSSILKADWQMGDEVDKFGDVINKICYAENSNGDGHMNVFTDSIQVILDGAPKMDDSGYVELSFKLDGAKVYEIYGTYDYQDGEHVVSAPTTGYKDVEDLLIEVSRSNYMKIAVEKKDGYSHILEIDNKGATKCFREMFNEK